jgi:gamma-butyrobetaine dioxygenase
MLVLAALDLIGLLSAVNQLSSYGLIFVTGVSNSETSDESCELRKLAEYFGKIRHTFYSQVWDVKDVRNSHNIAYTNLDLGLHMDLGRRSSHRNTQALFWP